MRIMLYAPLHSSPNLWLIGTRGGKRGGIFVVNIESPTQLPSLAEPLLLSFNASVSFNVCVTPEELGRKWG
jgi:hypothetical protein